MQINSIKCDTIMTVLKEIGRVQELAENLRMNSIASGVGYFWQRVQC